MKLLVAYLTGALGGFLAGIAGLVFIAQNAGIRGGLRPAHRRNLDHGGVG